MTRTETITGITAPQPGDTVTNRWKRGSGYNDGYFYTVERPVPTLPLGSVVKFRSGTLYVKTDEHTWSRIGNESFAFREMSDESVTKALTEFPPGLTTPNATLEYSPEA